MIVSSEDRAQIFALKHFFRQLLISLYDNILSRKRTILIRMISLKRMFTIILIFLKRLFMRKVGNRFCAILEHGIDEARLF